MIVPWTVDVPMQRYPLANWALMGFIAIVSLVVFVDDDHRLPAKEAAAIADRASRDMGRTVDVREVREAMAGPASHPLALHPANLRWWQPFTSQLIHGDFGHLLGNLIFLFCFGNAVNAKLGHFWFLVLYLSLGVAVDLICLLTFDPRPSLGASGAITATIGIYFVLYPRNDVQLFYWIAYVVFGVWRVHGGLLIAAYFAWDLLLFWLSSWSGIGHLAHLSGAVLGVATGLALVGWRWVVPEAYEENLLQVLGFHPKHPRYTDLIGKQQRRVRL